MRQIFLIPSVTKCVYFIGLYLNLIRAIQPSDLRVNWPKAHLPYIHLLTHSQRMCGPPVSSWAGQAKSCETVNDNMNYCTQNTNSTTHKQIRLFNWYFFSNRTPYIYRKCLKTKLNDGRPATQTPSGPFKDSITLLYNNMFLNTQFTH